MSGKAKQVTVVIPNYNGLRFLEPCFKALEGQHCKDFSVLVVDNGSTDGSVEWLKAHAVPSVFLGSNTGFSGAVNIGIRAADTPYVILLNNDTEVHEAYIGEMLKAIGRSEKIFSVSSKMISLTDPSVMDDAGDLYTLLGWACQRGVGRFSGLYKRPCRIFSACAGAAIYRRAVFEEIGYFDETHFAYLEDIDVGYRARLYGYDNIYCPTALVYHVGSGTSGSRYNAFKVRLAARNSIYVAYKNMPNAQLALNFPALAAGVAVKYGYFKKMGFAGEYADGIREALKTLGNCKRVSAGNLSIYVSIEFELIAGTLIYFYELAMRKLVKRKRKEHITES